MRSMKATSLILLMCAGALYFLYAGMRSAMDSLARANKARAAYAAAARARGTARVTLKPIATIELPGPKGKRFDYLTIDYDDGYLLSAHLGAGLLYVIDLKNNSLVAAVGPVPGVEGVEYVPGFKKAYTSDWFENKIGVVDLKAMKVVGRIPTEDKPDGSAYAQDFKKLYVSDERGKAEAVVDVSKDRIIKTLHFDSETGMPRYDPLAKLVYVNLQDKNEFAVIDPKTDEVVGRYPVALCRGNHGMALDVKHRRAFLVCEDSNQMAVFDLDRRKVIEALPIAEGGDVVKFDEGLGLVYVACYSGAISIFKETDPNHFEKLDDFATERRVHSLAVDQRTHRIYVPEEQAGGSPASRIVVYEPAIHR